DQAIEAGLRLFSEGADLVDVGGESTRPSGKVYGGGRREISVEGELERGLPGIEGLRRRTPLPLSVDTRKGAVASAAIDAGVVFVNDVSGGQFDPGLLVAAARLPVELILMHSRGTPENMQEQTQYGDVVRDVAAELASRIASAEA